MYIVSFCLQGYVIKDYEIIDDQGWINYVGPTGHYFTFSSEIWSVNIQGHITPNLTPGSNTFYIKIYFEDGFQAYTQESYKIKYNYKGVPGIEDWVEITAGTTSFDEGDWLIYDAAFHDVDPYGDEIDQWDIKIKLYSQQLLNG